LPGANNQPKGRKRKGKRRGEKKKQQLILGIIFENKKLLFFYFVLNLFAETKNKFLFQETKILPNEFLFFFISFR